MRFLLGRAGYKSCLTEDRDEALECYREALKHGHPFDAVILDWNSRGGRGITETVKKLFEIDPDAKIIVSSCVLDGPPITDISEYGFRGALAKPFTSDELEQVVHAVVNEPRHMKKVLIVDDNYYFLTGLSMGLNGYLKNCKILTAGNGRKALEIMEYIPVDLIVTDLEMPIMDGYVIDPNDPSPQSLNRTHRLEDVAGPNSSRQAVRGIIAGLFIDQRYFLVLLDAVSLAL